MDSKHIDIAALVLVALGALVCLGAGVSRLAGTFYLFGFQSVTLFIGGIALMVLAVYLKLHVLATR